MNAWDGNGPSLGFTLSDDDVLALVRNTCIDSTPADTYMPAIRAYQHLQNRAEEILNEQRANRQNTLIPADPALDTGCEGCE